MPFLVLNLTLIIMKKFFILAFGLVSLVSTAQKTIVEEKLDKDTKAVNFEIIPNTDELLIKKEKPIGGLVAANYIYNLLRFDNLGSKKVITDNRKLYSLNVSNSGKTYFSFEISGGAFSSLPLIFNEDKEISIDKSVIKKMNYSSFNLTTKNIYDLVNKNNYNRINLKKEDIFLNIYNLESHKFIKQKIQKPNLEKYLGLEYVKPLEDIGCKLFINYDETLDLITKSISNDYKKVVLYKSRLSDSGDITKEVEFKLELPEKLFFIYSFNHGGETFANTNKSGFPHFADDLSINNFIVDSKNGDTYIYGLYGSTPDNLRGSNSTSGFYIFKFDKEGKKIWESINPLSDPDINRSQVLETLFVNLLSSNNKLYFNIKTYGIKDFFNGTLLSKETGKIEKTQNFTFNETFSQVHIENQYFKINNAYKTDGSLRNKKYSFETISFLNFDKRVLNYIKTVNSKTEVFFDTFISNTGLWLAETDNKTYYKVTYFNHE